MPEQPIVEPYSVNELRKGVGEYNPQSVAAWRQKFDQEVRQRFPDVVHTVESDTLEKCFADAGLEPVAKFSLDAIHDKDTKEQLTGLLKMAVGYLDLPVIKDNLGLDPESKRRNIRNTIFDALVPVVNSGKTEEEKKRYQTYRQSRDEFRQATLGKLSGNAIQQAVPGVLLLPDILGMYLSEIPGTDSVASQFTDIVRRSIPADAQILGYDSLPVEQRLSLVDQLRVGIPQVLVAFETVLQWLKTQSHSNQ